MSTVSAVEPTSEFRKPLEVSQKSSQMGEYNQAVKTAQNALAEVEEMFGLEHQETARSLVSLATAYTALALHEKALSLQLRALAIYEKTLGSEHPETARALNDVALSYGALAQYKKALPLQLRALSIGEKVYGPEHPATALYLNNSAMSYDALAQYEEALSLQQRSLSIYEQTLGPEHEKTALALESLGHIYSRLAQNAKALPLQSRALVIYENIFGSEHPETARAQNNLALTLRALGQHEKALPLQLRALSVREKYLGPEHPDTAAALNNLALTYSALGNYDQALPLQIRALEIYDKNLGTKHASTAVAINNLALVYRSLGNHERSMDLLLRGHKVREEIHGSFHPATALSLANLAFTYAELAHYDKALPLQRRALSIFEMVLGSTHPSTAVAWGNMAAWHASNGQIDLAIQMQKRAVNIYQVNREQVSGIGRDESKSYTDSVSPIYKALARLLIEQDRLSEAEQVLDMLKEDEHYEFIRRSATSDPRSTRASYTATEQKWLNRYNQIAANLASLGVEERELEKASKSGLSPEQERRKKTLASDLAIARKAFDHYMAEIQTEFASKGPARAVEVAETSLQATTDLQQLVRSLGNDVVLLRYYITDDQVGILMTAPGVHVARNFKIDAKDLRRQVNTFRDVLRDRKADPMPSAQALYKVLIGPIEDQLQQSRAKTIMLSLDGALRYLPFGVLHDGKQYAAQRWNLPIYTSVVRDKLKDETVAKWEAAGLGVTKAWGKFEPLPSVRAEINSIVKVGNNVGVLPGEVFLDEAFSAKSLREVGMRKFQLMHIASHFQFSPGTESNSFLLMGDGKQLTLGDIRTQNFRFDNVDLLTLAACDTGLGGGRDAQGREIEGFGVIAQQQGAKAVLATLWPVADQSTSTLMADMYRRRQAQGLSKIEALRQSQVALMQQPKYAHPFYWAPFILMGNWR